jgi:peptidoglycan/xylan/chitin deacetylase (PgdA/CDA1 family)
MDTLGSRELPFTNSARTAYRSVRAAYRKLRAIKNYFLNFFDSPIIILVYHRVTDLPADPEMLAVSPGNFRCHMEFLKHKYSVLRFEEEWSNQKEPAVIITFDDGYADNVLEALPILEEVGVPATFFISTGRIGTGQEFWWHRLENILLREGEFPSRFTLNDARYGRARDTETFEQRRVLYAELNALMQRIGPEHQEAWLDQLRKWADPGDAGKKIHRSMTWEEIQRLAASPWATIGAHTVTHSALSALVEEQQRKEIFTCKNDLEKITGTEITTFSYPFGRKTDYDRTSVRLCREAGFIKAAVNFPGQVHSWTDPFQLPRHLVRNWDPDTFAAEMKGFWTR